MMIMSIIEKGITPIGINRKPLPYWKSSPPISISSPIYMISVVSEATIAGINLDINLLLPYNTVPIKIPVAVPNMIKNTDISTADKGDILIVPFL
jgi:hypothetical protein